MLVKAHETCRLFLEENIFKISVLEFYNYYLLANPSKGVGRKATGLRFLNYDRRVAAKRPEPVCSGLFLLFNLLGASGSKIKTIFQM